ncbi:MAG: S-ribosylhomocysteine lyase, partial [Clostridia bacterium]|nr:S-ribosylhomocysteine lyase [Clostridia bacterium]
IAPDTVYSVTVGVLKQIIAHCGAVFGASEVECGNYRSLDLDAAVREARRYLSVLEANPHPDFKYAE